MPILGNFQCLVVASLLFSSNLSNIETSQKNLKQSKKNQNINKTKTKLKNPKNPKNFSKTFLKKSKKIIKQN